MERIVDGSRMPKARLIGLVYLSYFLIAFLGDFFIKRVVVAGDPAATATNLLTHEATYLVARSRRGRPRWPQSIRSTTKSTIFAA